jgi:hypothetical protein
VAVERRADALADALERRHRVGVIGADRGVLVPCSVVVRADGEDVARERNALVLPTVKADFRCLAAVFGSLTVSEYR